MKRNVALISVLAVLSGFLFVQKVEAHDNKALYILGGLFSDTSLIEDYLPKNDVWRSYNGVSWQLISPNNPNTNLKWSPRSAHGVAVGYVSKQKGKRIVIAGGKGEDNQCFNDVWSSIDGISWQQYGGSVSYWSPREHFAMVYWDGYFWILGGKSCFSLSGLGDIWRSKNLNEWELVTNSSPWGPRFGLSAVVHNGALYVSGGSNSFDLNNEASSVWKTEDGFSWIELTDSAPFNSRWNDRYSLVSLNNKLYFEQFDYTSDSSSIWSSDDGESWGLVTSDLPWDQNISFLATFGNHFYVLEGTAFGEFMNKKSHRSMDGSLWDIANPDTPPLPRYLEVVASK